MSSSRRRAGRARRAATASACSHPAARRGAWWRRAGASRALRRGAGRAETLAGLSDELGRAAKRFDEAHDTAVEEAIATELDKWLRAAGFATIEARDEFSC